MKKTINNVRVFDGEKLSSLTNVFIENGYISSIGNVVFEADETIEDGVKLSFPVSLTPTSTLIVVTTACRL